MPKLGCNEWMLHQENAPSHMALSAKQFLTSKNITVIGHPSYQPGLTPCYFCLFSTIKPCIKGTPFTSVEEIHTKTENLRKGLPKASFQSCYQQWQHRMQKCVNTEGNYFERDTVAEN
ncbi:uncharacterized protein TNCV_129451 [Trichonephila clavipes]|nr:uncharacterized protein TNCV_129451 [Trichonephila clavipes]